MFPGSPHWFQFPAENKMPSAMVPYLPFHFLFVFVVVVVVVFFFFGGGGVGPNAG